MIEEDDEFLAKERELKEFQIMHVRKLESFIREKTTIIEHQEQELSQNAQDLYKLKQQINERDRMIGEYEGRLDKARVYIEQKEGEIASVKVQIHDMYEQYSQERDKNARLHLKLTSLERENKAIEIKHAGDAEDKVRAMQEEHGHEQRKLNHRIRELEKRLEVLKINTDERLNLALDQKDKEISKLQDRIQNLQFDHQNTLAQFDSKIAELQSDIQSRDKQIDSLKNSAQNQQALLQQHIDRLKDVLSHKTDLTQTLDQTNRQQQDQINDFKQKIATLEIKLSNTIQQSHFERDQLLREKSDLQASFQTQLASLEQDHQHQLKEAERGIRKQKRDQENLKQQVLEKEKGIRSKLESAWTDFEEKYAELEESKVQTEFKLQEAEAKVRELMNALNEKKRETKDCRERVDKAKMEIKIIQGKYEEELSSKESQLEEMKAQFGQMEQNMQAEIIHLKGELEKLFKKEIASRLSNNRLKTFNNPPISDEKDSFKMGMQRIEMIAQNSIRESKDKAAQQMIMNDSLDQYKKEFQKIAEGLMMESNVSSEEKSPLNKLQRFTNAMQYSSGDKGNLLLDKDLQIKQLQLENQDLKDSISMMTQEMERVMLEVKELKKDADFSRNNGMAGEQALSMQREIIAKERKIAELERRLRARDDEVERLKVERDRLIAISNELRGELNVAERRLIEQGENNVGYEEEAARREHLERELINIQLQEQSDKFNQIDKYVDDLAVQMREWIDSDMANHNQGPRSTERKVGGGGRIIKKNTSISPGQKMRKRGEEFLRKIEELKENIFNFGLTK